MYYVLRKDVIHMRVVNRRTANDRLVLFLWVFTIKGEQTVLGRLLNILHNRCFFIISIREESFFISRFYQLLMHKHFVHCEQFSWHQPLVFVNFNEILSFACILYSSVVLVR